MWRSLGFDRPLDKAGERMRDLLMALVVCRLLDPASKMATARMLNPESAINSLTEVLQLTDVNENDLYSVLDWLAENISRIWKKVLRGGIWITALLCCTMSPQVIAPPRKHCQTGGTCPLCGVRHLR
ncbi:MAG: hypothetical protein LBO64_00930 [Desulfovibrio sp.]|jgi:hypothetical protein|nr:hypothetical protein [Desulfovibrio sp.]